MFSIYYTTVCSGGSTDSTTTTVAYTVPVSTGSYSGSGSEGNEQQGDSTTLIGACSVPTVTITDISFNPYSMKYNCMMN